ncbi:MAG: quercetin dioxygenase-like cupin family protein/DNA-binding transcriptional regulator YiaG [Paraglaciecola sp.]|jgi:quercetin dioxygenase-like cupin family protein/DNA-binding transcriptional regulator YiaG
MIKRKSIKHESKKQLNMDQYILTEIGQKLRKIRKEKRLTVQTVASRAGVSKGFVSRIENSRTVPSLPVLIAIIKGMEVSLNAFFCDIDRSSLGRVVVKKASGLKTTADTSTESLFGYPIIDKNVPKSLVKTSILEIKSGGIGGNHSVKGFTFQYILEGKINYEISGQAYELEKGDSLYFDPEQVHLFENKGPDTARLLLVDFIT